MMRTVYAAVAALGLLAGTASAQGGGLERGKKVYAGEKCQVCHSIGGVGNKKGPLDEVGSKLAPAEIREWIVSAPEMQARTKATRKPVMKAYAQMAKDDLDALVAYLHSLKKP